MVPPSLNQPRVRGRESFKEGERERAHSASGTAKQRKERSVWKKKETETGLSRQLRMLKRKKTGCSE